MNKVYSQDVEKFENIFQNNYKATVPNIPQLTKVKYISDITYGSNSNFISSKGNFIDVSV